MRKHKASAALAVGAFTFLLALSFAFSPSAVLADETVLGEAAEAGKTGEADSAGEAGEADESNEAGEPDEAGEAGENGDAGIALASEAGDASDADVVELDQQSFTDAGGVYEITQPGTYELTQDVTGALALSISEASSTLNIDLKGHTITNPSTSKRAVVQVNYRGGAGGSAYVKNGKLVQLNEDCAAVSAQAASYQTNFENVSVSSTNQACVLCEIGRVTIRGGSFVTTITASEKTDTPVLLIEKYGDIVTTGGSFTVTGGSTVVKDDGFHHGDPNYGITIAGGEWSEFPEGAKLPYSGGHALVARKSVDGKIPAYSALTTYYAEHAGVCYVESGTELGNVYFESKDDAIAWAEERGLDPDKKIADVFKVTFDTDGGVDAEGEAVESWTEDVTYGNYATDPKIALYKQGYFFKGWVNPDKAQYFPSYDFANTPVYSNLTLKPVWNRAAAVVDGTYYETLQQAIDAAADGQTVTLYKDVDESVAISGKRLTLDLAGYTLSNSEGTTLSIKDGADVSLTGGAITNDANQRDAVVVEASVANFTDVDVTCGENGYRALCISADDSETKPSTVTISGGAFVSRGVYAVHVIGHSTLTVKDGTFDSASDRGLPTVDLSDASTMVVEGGVFEQGVARNPDSTLTVKGGSFGWAINKDDLEEGKLFFKEKGGYYKVGAYDGFIASANYVAYEGDDDAKVYFADGDEAASYAEEYLGDPAAYKAIYHVRIVERGNVLETRHLEQGSPLGELPQAAQVSGYTFAGWYVNGTKVGEDYEPVGNDDVVAMWVKDGADELVPTPQDGSGNDGKAIPQTGEAPDAAGVLAVAGAVLAGLGVAASKSRRI